MKKEVTLEEAIRRYQRGKDTDVLIPAHDDNGNDYYAKRSFVESFKVFDSALFLIEVESSPKKGVKLGPRKKKSKQEKVLITEESSSDKEIDEDIEPEINKVKKEIKQDKPESEDAKPKRIDIGKLCALYNGHWSPKDIASELNVTIATVYKYIKKIKNGEIEPHGYINGFDEPESEDK